MLVSQTSNPGVELFSYANACICIDAGHVSENTLYSSIGQGKFPKFLTGIFVEQKAPLSLNRANNEASAK